MKCINCIQPDQPLDTRKIPLLSSRPTINLSRQAIKDAPVFDSAATLGRRFENSIYKHYGREGYWTEELKREAAMSYE